MFCSQMNKTFGFADMIIEDFQKCNESVSEEELEKVRNILNNLEILHGEIDRISMLAFKRVSL